MRRLGRGTRQRSCPWLARPAPRDPHACAVPGYLLFGDNELKRVAAVVDQGAASSPSWWSGPARRRWPARTAPGRPIRRGSRRRSSSGLPGVAVKVVTLVRSRQTAADLAEGMAKVAGRREARFGDLADRNHRCHSPASIPRSFRAALDDGVETLHKGGADVILMNMQYSPRTESMIALGPYADTMRVVAQQHEVPLFDRLAIMRHWSDDRRLRSLRGRQGQRARAARARLHRPRHRVARSSTLLICNRSSSRPGNNKRHDRDEDRTSCDRDTCFTRGRFDRRCGGGPSRCSLRRARRSRLAAIAGRRCRRRRRPPRRAAGCAVLADMARFDQPLARTARSLAAGQPIKIVAIGSSSTSGAGASSPAASYPSRLAVELARRFPGHDDHRAQPRRQRRRGRATCWRASSTT